MIEATFKEFITQMAARTPTPGGGAAAACAATMGAALFTMVVRFSRGKKGDEARELALTDAERKLEECLSMLTPMAERDMASFEHVAAAYKLPRDSEEAKLIRTRAVQEALLGAMVVPEETICLARDAFAAVAPVVDLVGRNIVSDLGAGADLLRGGARAADLIVRVNAAYLDGEEHARLAIARLETVEAEIRDHHTEIFGVVGRLLGS